MTARQHHPACPSRHEGLCTGCIPEKSPTTHVPDITCACGESFVVAGETAIARERALAAWAGCCSGVAE